MRLIRLRIQAFGPYVNLQDIDFEALSQKHLFLIRGETGAGKTVILDAITYALFGKSSGGERGDFEQMRCRYAQDDQVSFVELIFQIKNHTYRFYREASIHKKRNGELVSKVIQDGGELINEEFFPFFENCKQKALEEKAETLIGLSHLQFVQVIMLPQGKFEQFLVCKSEEKQAILKTLFQVEQWNDICNNLSEKAHREKMELDTLHQQIQMLLVPYNLQNMEEIDEKLQLEKQRYEDLQMQQKQARKNFETLQKQLEEQSQLASVALRLQKRLVEREDLQKQKENIDALRSKLARQEELLSIKPYFDAYEKARKEVLRCDEVSQKLQDQWHVLETNMENLKKEQEKLPQQKEQLKQWEANLPLLHQERDAFVQQEKMKADIVVHQKTRQEFDQQMQVHRQDNEVIKQRVLDLQAKIHQQDEFLEAYPEALAKQQQFLQAQTLQAQYEKAVKQHETVKKQIHRLASQCELQSNTVKKQEQAHEELYQYYLNNSAAMLADLLKEGEACPVCGSTTHPRSAHIESQVVELAQLRACKALLEEENRKLQELFSQQSKQQIEEQHVQKDIEQIQEQIHRIFPSGYDESLHQENSTYIQKCKDINEMKKAQAIRLQRDFDQMETNEKVQLEIQEKQRTTQQAEIVLQTQIKQMKGQAHYDFSSIEEADRMMQENASNCLHLKKQIQEVEEQLQQLERLLQENQTSMKYSTKEKESWQENYRTSKEEFENVSSVDARKQIENFQFESLEEGKLEIAKFDQRLLEHSAALKELQSQLEHKEIVDVKQVQALAQESELQYHDAMKANSEQEAKLKQLETTKKSLMNKQNQYLEKQRTYFKRNEFVKAMRGDNSIGIERYVLGIMLSSVTQYANQLLRFVHDGRYQIYRSNETSGRTRKFGLELCIYDAYSASTRSVVSLSGGEKFLVSLALSLALSTTLQTRSGGIHIEAMFIDEGFGSLDEQSISDALQVLSTMSQNKAMIGIISHVEILKENIPYGMYVEKDKEGSNISLLL